MWREIIYGNRHNVIEGLSTNRIRNQTGKEILSQEDEGQALESYLERGRETMVNYHI